MRERVWVLWARTWNNGDTRLHKVTSKRVWQKYVEVMKRTHKNYKEGWLMLPSYVETLPKFYQESTDKAALEIMRDLAHPVTEGN